MNSCSDISICISISIDIYGWSKSSLGVSCKILWTNPNELFGQPYIYTHRGFPGGSVVKNSPANAGDMFSPWVRNIPWRRKWQPTPVFFPGKSNGQRRLVGYNPWGCKESDSTYRLSTLGWCQSIWLEQLGAIGSITWKELGRECVWSNIKKYQGPVTYFQCENQVKMSRS